MQRQPPIVMCFNLNLSTYSYFGDRLFGLLSFSTSGPMIDVISITDSCSIGDAAKRNVSEFTVLFISCGSSFYHNGSSIAQSGRKPCVHCEYKSGRY